MDVMRHSLFNLDRYRRRLQSALALCALLLLPLIASGPGFASVPAPLVTSEQALLDGRADAAVAGLHAALAAHPASGAAHLLLCRVWLSEELATEAVAECQAALADGLANDSAAQDWTGRALGMEAEHAGKLKGLTLALRVRDAFETAVNLDPNSEAACVDLGQYYTSAPPIVGGGNAKALALAARIEPTLPAVAHRIRAMAAERDKDLAGAEREFQAEAAAGHQPGATVDLAAFYARHQQVAKAANTARETLAEDRRDDASVVEAGTLLLNVHQNTLAQNALRAYLRRGEKSDAAPAFRVHTILGSMLAQAGDKAGARAEFEQALALASQYAPAQKGLGAL